MPNNGKYANRYWETNQGSISNIYGQCVDCGLENGLNIHIDLCGYEANEVRIIAISLARLIK